MQQIQVAKAERTGGAVKIVKKLIAEVESDIDPGDVWGNYWILKPVEISDTYEDIEAFGRFTKTDFALELMGNRLWLWSVKVMS